jgi:hypothetical protein
LDGDGQFVQWESQRKSSSDSRIPVTSLKEIRRGQNTDTFRRHGKTFDPEHSFSVIYGDEYASLDLVANTNEEANIWIEGLTWLLDEDYGIYISLYNFENSI